MKQPIRTRSDLRPRPLTAPLAGLLVALLLASTLTPSARAQTPVLESTTPGANEPSADAPPLSVDDGPSAAQSPLTISEPAPTEPHFNAWAAAWQRAHFYADFRVRAEHEQRQDPTEDRNRMRLRARLGAEYEVMSTVEVGARVVTGLNIGHPSSHLTLGDAYANKSIVLDRVFVRWRPRDGDVYLMAGKFPQNWNQSPIYGELTFDADVQPEGVQLGWVHEGGNMEPSGHLVLGGYVVNEGADSSDPDQEDVYSLQAQASTRYPIVEKFDVRFALGVQSYTSPTALVNANRGNAVSNGEFVSDFTVLDSILAFDIGVAGAPLIFSLEAWQNLRAEPGSAGLQDTGYALGTSWGSMREAGQVRVSYQYQVVEQDSVFSVFAQDDFLRATNFTGHLAGVNTMLTDTIGLNLWGLWSSSEDPSLGGFPGSEWRLRLDLNIHF